MVVTRPFTRARTLPADSVTVVVAARAGHTHPHTMTVTTTKQQSVFRLHTLEHWSISRTSPKTVWTFLRRDRQTYCSRHTWSERWASSVSPASRALQDTPYRYDCCMQRIALSPRRMPGDSIQTEHHGAAILRLLVVWLVGALLLGLACGYPAESASASTAPTMPPELLVGANIYEPFVYYQDGELVGFDVDLVNLIASLNGWTVRYEVMPFTQELQAIRQGTVDLGIGSIFRTPERASRISFTNAYLDSGLVLVTQADSPIRLTSGLAGHRVAVKAGTASDDYVAQLSATIGKIDVLRYASSEEVIGSVARGKADAAVHDYLNAQYLINRSYVGALVLHQAGSFSLFLTGRQPLAFPAARNMLPLLPQFNRTLAHVQNSGLLTQMQTKWFGTTTSFGAESRHIRTALIVLAVLLAVGGTARFLVVRERAARTTRERAAYYQQLFSAVPEPAMLVYTAPDGLRIEATNTALDALLGRNASDLVGARLGSIMVAKGTDASQTLVSVLDQSLSSTRWHLSASDGEVIPVKLMVSNLPPPSGRIVMVAHDLREQLSAEQTVRAAYEQYHTLFDDAPDPILILRNHTIIQANIAAGRTLGTTPEHLVNRRVEDISPQNQADGVASQEAIRLFENKALLGTLQRFDWTFLGPSGRMVVCEASLKSMPTAGPGIIQAIFRDVTDQRTAEERSRQLETELVQSRKMEAVGRLAGGIAHDFNNIIGGIMGHASLLKVDMPEGSEAYRELDTIERAAMLASQLTHRLLTFSRKEALTLTDIDVSAVLEDTLSIATPGFDKRTELVTHVASDLAFVSGDRMQFEEVLLNLVINARDAIGHREGTITVEARNITPDDAYWQDHAIPPLAPGNYVELTLSDTGVGLSEEAKAHLFEPFFTTRPQGTGLGLSIAWRVIHDMGGTIAFASARGHGTTFTLVLPAVSRADAQKHGHQPVLPASLPPSLHGESVFVVDDEDVVRSVAVKVLTGLGYQVTESADPVAALETYRSNWQSIDLVLLDMMMPHMNGRQLFEKMREINPAVAAVLMSGDATGTAEGATWFVGFISKPYTLQELATIVRQSLSTSAERASTMTGDSAV